MVPSKNLSIIVPVYYGADTVGRLVDSVVDAMTASIGKNQFEIILINDGSRDKSEEICTALTSRYPEIVLFIELLPA
jgi:undecaprenyl-phosphate 4-deoxy-4-formamido-L-arabinose transferase